MGAIPVERPQDLASVRRMRVICQWRMGYWLLIMLWPTVQDGRGTVSVDGKRVSGRGTNFTTDFKEGKIMLKSFTRAGTLSLASLLCRNRYWVLGMTLAINNTDAKGACSPVLEVGSPIKFQHLTYSVFQIFDASNLNGHSCRRWWVILNWR